MPADPATPKDQDDPRIQERLHAVLELIMCPVAGCWSLHGVQVVYYLDEDAGCYVLETWPVGVEEPAEHEGNGTESDGLLYELAELDFSLLVAEVPVEQFHYSQRQSVFEIGWKEFGHQLELRVHLMPADVSEEV